MTSVQKINITPIHHHVSHPFVVTCALSSVAALMYLGLAWPANAVTYKTYKHATHRYTFQHPSTWTTVTKTYSVAVKPLAATLKSLASRGVSYSLNTTWLNNDSAVFTTTIKNALAAGWAKFVPAYAKTLEKKYGATATVKTYKKINWLASEIIIKRKVNGVVTTWRFVVLTRDKKKVFVVGEKWTTNSSSPLAADVATLLKTFTNYTPPVVTWSFDGATWKASSPPPACANPVILLSPVDLTKVYSILYPGQYRSGNYKPHGGFRLDGQAYDTVTVRAPADAYFVGGARYLEGGIVQYMLDFVLPCGIRYRFDHLYTLSPSLAVIAATFPAPVEGDSRTTTLAKPVAIKAGDVVATAAGGPIGTGFDFGVYDLRQRNAASQSTDYQAAHGGMISNAYYAACWFDWLSVADEATVRALPPGDGQNGATSDYCQ